MHTFNSVHRLTEVIEAAKDHCLFLGSYALSVGYHARMRPVVLVDFEHALSIPAYESIAEINVNRVNYHRKFLTVFRYGKEPCGQEGTGWYGLGMYSETTGGSWRCDSILFGESAHEPLLVKGRDAALKIATDEARLRDKSCASENEKAILEHGLIEAPVLNALLGALLRAEPETAPATIGIRARSVHLLLEGDEGDGRRLLVPKEGFLCRDAAAGVVLGEIAYTVDGAMRMHRYNEPAAA